MAGEGHLRRVYTSAAIPSGFLPWKPPAVTSFAPAPPGPPQNAKAPADAPLETDPSGSAVTSLDPDDLPAHPAASPLPPPAAPSESLCCSFRHSGWRDVRTRVYKGLQAAGVPASRLTRFANCGSSAWVECSRKRDYVAGRGENAPVSSYRVRCNTCKDRFCVPCAGTRARIVSRTLIDLLGGEPARFITLTVKHNDTPLREQVDRLYSCYKRLRKTVLWQRHVYAAAALLEVKRGATDKLWHPHLHVLAKGKFVPHADLKEQWHRITQDSYVVDIRLIRDHAKAASYVSKYVTKPMVQTYSTDPDAVAEAIEAMHHRRTVLLTGDWKKLNWEKQTDDLLWTWVGNLDSLVHRALAGEPDALQVMDRLRSNGKWRPTENARSP